MVLSSADYRTEDAESFKKYQRQLCLPISQLARKFGPAVVRSVALTGSDPYLPTGTDVAILLESPASAVIETYLKVRRLQALNSHPNTQAVQGKIHGVAYAGLTSPDRFISTYTATLGNAVVVTNSPEQLKTLIATHQGKVRSLAELDEYRFFRQRYKRSEPAEAAFLIISDATIRRWCSPRWRIGASRRLRAAALLADHQAAHMPALLSGRIEPKPLASSRLAPGGGTFRLSGRGVRHSHYGSFDFLTPIRELDLERVTTGEKEAYERWRNGYERNWSGAFDPIAARFVIADERLGMDLTVMPLIAGSGYRSIIDVVQGATLQAEAGDRHDGELLRFSMALNKESQTLQEAKRAISGAMPQLKIDPLSWLGQSVHLYVDQDQFWAEAMKSGDPEEFLEANWHRLPIAAHAEVTNGLKLTLFLTAFRTYMEKSSPGMLIWETAKHNEMPYVRVRPSAQAVADDEDLKGVTICYAATAKSLVISPSEPLIHRVLDRLAARRRATEGKPAPQVVDGKKPGAVKPWLGKHVAFQFDAMLPQMLRMLTAEHTAQELRRRSLSNIPILNEWKRLYPDRDPLEVHRQIWS
ncbi:MAG: hypothetical protein R3236_10510, partial [Phycisphaeraceae bacterium]|nr:hypothetical protein [Phycisphaeraceae bacterium]